MLTGQTLESVLASPQEFALWQNRLKKTSVGDRLVHGDTVLYRLLAQLGCLVEAFMCKGQPDTSRWYFWHDEFKDDDTGNLTQEELDRKAAMGEM